MTIKYKPRRDSAITKTESLLGLLRTEFNKDLWGFVPQSSRENETVR